MHCSIIWGLPIFTITTLGQGTCGRCHIPTLSNSYLLIDTYTALAYCFIVDAVKYEILLMVFLI